jgi:hypothetical protein
MDRNLALAFTTVAMAALGAVSLSTGTDAVQQEPAALVSVSGDLTRSAPLPPQPGDNEGAGEAQDGETELAAIDGAPLTYQDNAASEEHEASLDGEGSQSSTGSAWASRGPRGATQYAANEAPPPPGLAQQMHF